MNHCPCEYCLEFRESDRTIRRFATLFGAIAITVFTIFFLLFKGCNSPAFASSMIDGYTADQWCNAIYYAENSPKHPYGILRKYRHTTPRQACLNTVTNNNARWLSSGSKMPYIAFLQQRYCPIGSNTDNGTCQYWQGNVKHYLEKE